MGQTEFFGRMLPTQTSIPCEYCMHGHAQTTQDHGSSRKWSRVLNMCPASFVYRAADTRSIPQVRTSDAPRTNQTKRRTNCMSSRATPHDRARTAKDHGLAPQCWRERALGMPQATINTHRSHHKVHMHIRRYNVQQGGQRGKACHMPLHIASHGRIGTA